MAYFLLLSSISNSYNRNLGSSVTEDLHHRITSNRNFIPVSLGHMSRKLHNHNSTSDLPICSPIDLLQEVNHLKEHKNKHIGVFYFSTKPYTFSRSSFPSIINWIPLKPPQFRLKFLVLRTFLKSYHSGVIVSDPKQIIYPASRHHF